MLETMKQLLREDDGAAAAEYAILVALIASAVVLAVQLFDLDNIFAQVSSHVKGKITQSVNP